MNKADFMRWFNLGFWKAFTKRTFPISIPKTPAERKQLLDSVFDEIESARYAPGIPEAELVMNKGHGVARTITVFSMQDYCV